MQWKLRTAKDAAAGRKDESWGSLTWIASQALGNAEGVTIGRVVLKGGQVTGRHTHRGCEEAVYMLSGELDHSLDSASVHLSAGDMLVVPLHVFHSLKNAGPADADVIVAFSSGARDTEPEARGAVICPAAESGRPKEPVSHGRRIDEPWGSLTWLASREIGNADGVTVGRVVIKRGRSNPRHAHNACEEVLYLLAGELDHTIGGETVRLTAGDTLTVPAGAFHNAASVGSVEADMIVVYSSGTRDFVKE